MCLCINLLHCRTSMSVRKLCLNLCACMRGCYLDCIRPGTLVRMRILNLKGADVIDLQLTLVNR